MLGSGRHVRRGGLAPCCPLHVRKTLWMIFVKVDETIANAPRMKAPIWDGVPGACWVPSSVPRVPIIVTLRPHVSVLGCEATGLPRNLQESQMAKRILVVNCTSGRHPMT